MSQAQNNFGQITFGAGTAILTPFGANAPENPTPLQLPIMQELSIDWNGDIAELYGQGQYSYGQARTKVKIDCKAKIGAIYLGLLSDLFFGATITVGTQIKFSLQEINTVTTHACTVAHSANFLEDGGVVNGTTGVPYRLVASAPAVGQYTVSAGVYTFNASDTITVAYITYTYTASTGQEATVTNVPMGQMPTFNFKYMNNQWGPNLYIEFFNAVAKKIGSPNKNTDFSMFDFEFTCFASQNGNVFTMSTDE